MNYELISRAKKVGCPFEQGTKRYTRLLLPDAKDSRWAVEYSSGDGLDDGGIMPISEKRAERFIAQLEKKAKKMLLSDAKEKE
jgi:hypothetical protein